MDDPRTLDPRAHSRFIAALIGPVVMAVGLSMLMNPGIVAALSDDIAASPALMMTSGVIAMLLGLAIVKSHNRWKGWPLAVTLVGWIAVIGGLLRVAVPDFVISLAREAALVPGEGLAPFAGAAFLAVGAFFTWQGWLAEFVSGPAPASTPDAE